MSEDLVRKIKRFLRQLLDRKFDLSLLPATIRDDAVFLVSYPRSGNTWVRFLLANLLSYPGRRPVDFYSIHQIIPDLEIREHREIIEALSSPRIIKSHASYRPDFPRVIYLVRDGRDVYVSYYDFLTKQGLFSGSLADLLAGADDLPYGSWHSHVESWLRNNSDASLLLVRYEDLLRNTQRELKRMAEYVSLEVTDQQIDWAVKHSSFKKMRRLEETKGRPYGKRGHRFVRSGRAGGWMEHFDERCKEIFKSSAGEMLIRLGYVDDMEW